MLSQFILQLNEAEREAVGVAAVNAFHDDDTLGYQGEDLEPMTLSTQETIEVAPVKAYETYRTDAYSILVSRLCPLAFPHKPRSEREDVITAPSHAMISMSRISTGGTTLFDHLGDVQNPMAIRLHTTRDYLEKDRATSNMMRMEEKQLLEIMLSSSQYARLLRSDSSLTPCTVVRRERVGYTFEHNPHFDNQFDSRNVEQEARDILASERENVSALTEIIKDGVTRKADREHAEAKMLAILEALDSPIEKLHGLADSAQEQAGHSAQIRHSNLMAREVSALPPGMRNQLKQLSDEGNPVAKLLTAKPHDD